MVVTFCGHRDFSREDEYERKILDLLTEKVGDSPADFYLGDYGTFDSFAYKCCRKYKKTHPNVMLFLVTPYITIEYQRNVLERKKIMYDGIIYPEIEDKPLKFAISYRNKWMVDKADYVICGISRFYGGAYKTYLYAKQKKKVIFNIFEL